jgi:hypothetical protein
LDNIQLIGLKLQGRDLHPTTDIENALLEQKCRIYGASRWIYVGFLLEFRFIRTGRFQSDNRDR